MLRLYPFNITVAFVKDITHIEYRNLIVVYKFINKISIDTMKQLKRHTVTRSNISRSFHFR